MSNGPEFQVPYRPAAEVKTLRDEFAMAAMQGILVNSNEATSIIAKWAYDAADAMMAERAKR